MNKHNELHNGVNGSGNTVYLVVTVDDETGQWIWTETFKTEAEAEAWMKCCTY